MNITLRAITTINMVC